MQEIERKRVGSSSKSRFVETKFKEHYASMMTTHKIKKDDLERKVVEKSMRPTVQRGPNAKGNTSSGYLDEQVGETFKPRLDNKS